MLLRRGNTLAIALFIVGLAVALAFGRGGTAPAPPGSASPPAAVRSAIPSGTSAVDSSSGLPAIRAAALPAEARATLALVADGGPYPNPADGATFQNRERLLPTRPAGYYREYTVETPGSADRGARRIVTGLPGEAYWTADHYASFSRILP